MRHLHEFGEALILASALTVLAIAAKAQTHPAYPTYIAGAGASFFNPGTEPIVDVDYHLGTGMFYGHVAISNVTAKNGQLFAIFGPGAEARVFTSANGTWGFTLEGQGNIAESTNLTLGGFTAGGYAWMDLPKVIKSLQKVGHLYLESGGSIAGGSLRTTATSSSIQIFPTLKLRVGGS